MSRSPKACSPTDRRVDYLVQAKQDRERRMSDKKRMGGGSISKSIFNPGSADVNDWASNANLRNDASASAFKKRNMTFDAGRDSQLDKKLHSPTPTK